MVGNEERTPVSSKHEADDAPHRPQPESAEDPAPKTALAVVAHPDDADFGAAGTLAGWVDEGWEVTLLVCTHGEQGGFDDEQHERMPEIRDREQRAASAELGITDVRFLQGYRDGWLQPTHELQKDIVRVIRQVRPSRMVIQSSERDYQRINASHPDHLACGEATIRAIYPAAENQFAFPELLREEGLERFSVPEFWVMGHATTNYAVDITDRFDRKVAALRAHESQTGHLGYELDAFLRKWGELVASRHALGHGRIGEAFLRVIR